jgi:uncharacterized protein YbjT (DUF2867 family)
MYALMGANGNITSKAAGLLLAQRKTVRVIGRDAIRLKPLRDAGAELAVGDALDATFLAQAFRGAKAVYTMIPPDYTTPDFRQFQNAVGEAIASAIAKSGVMVVVNLSSAGASLPGGTGPIAGLHDQEQRLNKLAGVNILHLRPGYFMENHLHAVSLIKATGAYPDMIAADAPIPMIATQDIAEEVAKELMRPSFKGHVVKHLLGPRSLTMAEAAGILGAAIGKPDLRYVEADPAQAKAGMVQHGFSQNLADLIEELNRALSNGCINDTFTRDMANSTATTLESFAPVFAQAYNAGGAH